MSEQNPALPAVTPDQQRVAQENFERGNQVAASDNHDYAIKLYLTSCRLNPAELKYRQALRRTQKAKYKNNQRGSAMATLSTAPTRARLKTAEARSEYLKVLELGEDILTANPWDISAQVDMAEAADAVGLLDVAIWLLVEASPKEKFELSVARPLARLLEKRGNFKAAIALWERIRQVAPSDQEAAHKAKDLAASETIQRSKAAPGDGSAMHAALREPSSDRVTRESANLQARIDANPGEPGPYKQMAATLRRAGDADKAREVLEQGLEATGQHWELVLELAEFDLEPIKQELAATEERMRGRPAADEVEPLRQSRMRLLREVNNREIELFRMKAEHFPGDMAHRLELGFRLLRAGKIDEAITELQQARRDNRFLWKALMYLGHCFKQRNNWRLAQRNFEEALQSVPAGEEASRKEILYHLARGLADAGDLAKALDHAHDLANLDFAYKDIGKLMDEWERRLQEA